MFYPRSRVYPRRKATSSRSTYSSPRTAGAYYARRAPYSSRSYNGRRRVSSYHPTRQRSSYSSSASSAASDPNQIFRVSQIYDATFTSGTGGTTLFSYYHTLSQLDQAATFASVFDQYRLVKVTATARPRATQSSTVAASVGANLYTVIDYDDATNLGTVNDARQFQTLKEYGPYESFTRVYRPHIAIGAYSGATFSGYANSTGAQWLDANSPGIQYYGLKVLCPPTTIIQTWDWTFKCEYEFKNVH